MNKIILLILLLSIFAETAFAARQHQPLPTEAADSQALSTAKGLIMLDYEVVPVSGNASIDLLGAHYLHQLNPWIYLGLGLYTPLVHGNYGGFMAFDANVHAQHRILGNLFIDAGGAFGGGGGGSSNSNSRVLSGKGGFYKGYAGLGYRFPDFSLGVNYAYFRFMKSQIKHSQVDVFFQRPFSSRVGFYADAGRSADASEEGGIGENTISLEFNNIFQIHPKGTFTNDINLASLQFSHFESENAYLYFGVGVGYNGLPLYNQVFGGIGYRVPISSRLRLYGQVGVGSGGYTPTQIDTGSGLLVYPKASLEYMLNSHLGLAGTAGYLIAPYGSSRNYTLGAAVNYHLSTRGAEVSGPGSGEGLVFRGFRFSLYQQTMFDVRVRGKKQNTINMVSGQIDYLVNDHWYIPLQASIGYNGIFGYPGYGELLTGIGLQSRYDQQKRLQGFVQLLVGVNILDIVFKPTIGMNYSLSDSYALYGQVSKLIPIVGTNPYGDRLHSAFSTGIGVTYRFSVPDAVLH